MPLGCVVTSKLKIGQMDILENPVPCNCANINCAVHKGTLCSGTAYGKKCDNDCGELHYLGDGVVSDDARLCFECGGHVVDVIQKAAYLMGNVHPHLPHESVFHSISCALSIPIHAWVAREQGGAVPQRVLKDLMYLLQFCARFCPPDLEERALQVAADMADFLEPPSLNVH
jgi:hypothetical protein